MDNQKWHLLEIKSNKNFSAYEKKKNICERKSTFSEGHFCLLLEHYYIYRMHNSIGATSVCIYGYTYGTLVTAMGRTPYSLCTFFFTPASTFCSRRDRK